MGLVPALVPVGELLPPVVDPSLDLLDLLVSQMPEVPLNLEELLQRLQLPRLHVQIELAFDNFVEGLKIGLDSELCVDHLIRQVSQAWVAGIRYLDRTCPSPFVHHPQVQLDLPPVVGYVIDGSRLVREHSLSWDCFILVLQLRIY